MPLLEEIAERLALAPGRDALVLRIAIVLLHRTYDRVGFVSGVAQTDHASVADFEPSKFAVITTARLIPHEPGALAADADVEHQAANAVDTILRAFAADHFGCKHLPVVRLQAGHQTDFRGQVCRTSVAHRDNR